MDLKSTSSVPPKEYCSFFKNIHTNGTIPQTKQNKQNKTKLRVIYWVTRNAVKWKCVQEGCTQGYLWKGQELWGAPRGCIYTCNNLFQKEGSGEEGGEEGEQRKGRGREGGGGRGSPKQHGAGVTHVQMWVSGVTVSLHVRMLEMLKKKSPFTLF